MTREQLIEAIGVQGRGNYSFVVCESQEETLIVAPLMETIYGVPRTDWEQSNGGRSYWKYLFLAPRTVNAYGNGVETIGHRRIAAADLFPAEVHAPSVDVSDLI